MTRRGWLASWAAAERRPNIVVILADDLGIGDVSCYNPASRIATPAVDGLAHAGMRFTDAHTPSAVCTPTRYGLLTGRYCWRSQLKEGVLDGIDPALIEAGRPTIATVLKAAGYETACFGKWHLGMNWTGSDGQPVPFRYKTPGIFRDGRQIDYTKPVTGGPNDQGFDEYFGIAASLDMSPYCFIENRRTMGIPSVETPDDRSLFMNQVPGVKTPDFRLEDVVPRCTAKAVEFIERRRTKPFFVYVPLTSPHLPIVPNEKFKGTSRAGLFGDFVQEMDAAVGEMLAAIERTGQAENTLVIFTSDNGGLWHLWEPKEVDDVAGYKPTPRGRESAKYGHYGNIDWRGTKADIYEGGHRVPFIARWPRRVKAGAVSGALACLTDVFATCAEAAGVKIPASQGGEDSLSLVPVLTGRRQSVRRDVIHHSHRGHFALRSGDWKYAPLRGSGGFSSPNQVNGAGGQLYDLRSDPHETTNLWAKDPARVAAMDALLKKQMAAGRTR